MHSSPDITYTLICGKIPISTELKCFREFDVENRTEGNAGMLTASLPLSVGHRCLLMAHCRLGGPPQCASAEWCEADVTGHLHLVGC